MTLRANRATCLLSALAASATGVSLSASGQSIVCDEAIAIPAPISTDIGFGRRVAASGNRAIVGRYGDVSVSILDLDTNLELFAIEPDPIVSSSGGLWDTAVDIDADHAIVGVPGEDSAGADAGAAYLFDVTTGSQLFKLTAADAAPGARFGYAVAIDGGLALVGTYVGTTDGAAYLFDVATGIQLAKLTPSDAEPAGPPFFGQSVAIDGDFAIIGARGAAYLFDLSDVNNPVELSKLTTAFFPLSGFGQSVDIDGTLAIVGQPTEGYYSQSHALLYDVPSATLLRDLIPVVDPYQIAVGGNYGWSVSLDGGLAVVAAAPGHDPGAAYLLEVATGLQLAELRPSGSIWVLGEYGDSTAIAGGTILINGNGGSNGSNVWKFDATACAPTDNTQSGTGVEVSPVAIAGEATITLTFDQIDTSGNTSFYVSDEGPEAPQGFYLSGAYVYYDILTSASFTNMVEVCIDYSSEADWIDENNLYLLHYENGSWVDVTTSKDTVVNRICGQTDSLSPFALFARLDSDGDGLNDADEAVFGTDPTDPDTDDDGLLDGTEVDIAMGGGCPDALVADSDGDTLLDGEEVLLGTNPCAVDTDDDGLIDPFDPDPTSPGTGTDALEEVTRAIAAYLDSTNLALYWAPNENAAAGRRNSLVVRLHNAANAIASGDSGSASALLTTVLNRMDGDPQIWDWLMPSDEAEFASGGIQFVLAVIGE